MSNESAFRVFQELLQLVGLSRNLEGEKNQIRNDFETIVSP